MDSQVVRKIEKAFFLKKETCEITLTL